MRRKLSFFEEFDDDAMAALIEAMEVYQFEPGDKVVRQGDVSATSNFLALRRKPSR